MSKARETRRPSSCSRSPSPTSTSATGVTTGDYTRTTGAHGLATGLGDTPTVGLGGITLAGGIGFLVRKNGLAIDDLLAAEVVSADGELLEVDEETHADLFWAIRGGGGNFGVAMHERPEEGPEHETWAMTLAEALSDGETAGAYVGFVGDEGDEGVRRAYPPATLDRLAEVKRR